MAPTELHETNVFSEGGSISTWNSPCLFKYTLEIPDRSILVEWHFFLTVDGGEPTYVTQALAHDSSHSSLGVWLKWVKKE